MITGDCIPIRPAVKRGVGPVPPQGFGETKQKWEIGKAETAHDW